MILWGFGSDRVELGAAEARECRHCSHRRPFRHVLRYRFVHIWYLFCWVTEKRYLAVCEVCCHGVQQDTREFERGLDRSPIPFYRRLGWLVLLALVAIVGGACLLRARREAPQDDAPQLAWRDQLPAGSTRYLSFSRT